MLHFGTPEEAGFEPKRIELIESRAREWVDAGLTPTLVVLAARNGIIVVHKAYGKRTPDGEPLTPDAIFPCASMAKPVTATGAMILVEEGLLSLNRPVIEYIPELSGKNAEHIVVHQLMTHTSGLVQDYGTQPAELPDSVEEALRRALASACELDPSKAPGEQNIYSMANYVLLGEIVSRVSGQPLEEFLKKRIFDPLGMVNTSFRLEERFKPKLVKRDPAYPGGIAMNNELFLDTPRGDSGLLSCAEDLARFVQLFLDKGASGDERILKPWTVEEMTRNQIPGVGCDHWSGHGWVKEASWGLGWLIQGNERWRGTQGMLQPRGCFYHGGFAGTNCWGDPQHNLLGVFLSVSKRFNASGDYVMENDLFQNLVTSAVAD